MANGYPGIPCMAAIALAVGTKGSVHITAAGLPCFSNTIPSCILHEEHDPQSPVAVINMSHFSKSS
jgi:hypothetical protein